MFFIWNLWYVLQLGTPGTVFTFQTLSKLSPGQVGSWPKWSMLLVVNTTNTICDSGDGSSMQSPLQSL